MAAQDIIIRPIITEKTMAGISQKKYTFEVSQGRHQDRHCQARCGRAFRREGQQGEHPPC